MSAALQLPTIWAAAAQQSAWQVVRSTEQPEIESADETEPAVEKKPVVTLAFYRKHTESLLRRYLYASMLVGRAPSILDHPVARGWASSRPVRTFEEAVNFVLDIENCVAQLSALDRCLLSRIVLQEYTVGEAAIMLGINVNTTATKLSLAVDKLTEILLKADLLVLPH
jgi:DNA-directed RNA polymerase specialized sigma24 family protein